VSGSGLVEVNLKDDPFNIAIEGVQGDGDGIRIK
jgi:hypothetical protein